ncbi:CHAT domain-containing protein [Mesorhizobium sp. M0618]|uniref:CHAT domain-containing protein n=1 Tax=unclassified Mesorhizobium TaxID=325217 RepID=UPI00333A2263
MSDERRAVNIKRDDHAVAGREIQDFIARNPNIFGGADIFNLDFGTPIIRAGMLASVLTGLFDEERRPAVRRWVVIAPPGTDRATTVEAALAQFRDSFNALAERELQPKELEALRSRFDVVVANDRRHRSVLDLIDAQPERTAVIVMEAASYRDDQVVPYIAPGAESPLRAEDFWAPQLHALASAATSLAGENRLYVALDADELSPRRQALADLLLTIEGCGVMGSSSDDDPQTILATHVDRWDAWIREGRLGQALQDVDRLPASLERQKDYLRIQLLYRAGHLERALQAIRERLEVGSDLDPSARVKLARVAEDANASRLAGQLLVPIIDALESREDLESALATTSDAGLDDLEERTAARLEALFPGSASLQRRRLKQLVRKRDYVGAAKVAREELTDEKGAEFFDTLALRLSGHPVPDYHALIAEAGRDAAMAEAYRMASVSDALVRKLVVHAFELVRPLPSTPGQARHGERLLLETLEALLLVSSKDGGWPVDRDRFQAAVLDLIERLASNPDNRALRVGLVRLLQPGVAGTTGLALMAVLVLQLASRPIELRKGGAPGRAGMEWLMGRKPFLTAAFNWMKTEEPLVIGRSVLPVELLTEPADEVVSAVASYLTYAPPGASDDTSAMLTWLAFGASVAPHSSDPDYDLRLIRLVAGKLASAGDVQQARDLAEQALMNGAATARRRRLGWFAMADVYARTGDSIEALLAIACTLAADTGGDEEEIYQEITGVARLFRNCGLHDQARTAIDKARDLLHRMDLHEHYAHQLDTLELQLRQMTLKAAGDHDAALTALLVDVVANGCDVLRYHGHTAPAGAMLGQLLRTAHLLGLPVPPDAEATLKELQKHARGSFGELLAAMSAARPDAQQLFAVVRSLGAARYSDDVGFDMRNLAIAGGRALAGDDLLKDAKDTAFVLDLLADRGVAVPGWDEAAVPAPAPASIRETAEIARAVSRAGLNVLQAGFDEDGHLVRLATIAGELGEPVREPADVILKERLNHWATKFPYAYGIDEVSANLFYTTTADLRLSALPDGPVVVAADASFQVFPPNLLFVDGEFAGRTRPMAATPSLAWLGRARETAFTGDGRLCAWISTAVGGDSQTLPMIAERLQPTFEDHGFAVDHGPVLPGAFAGATLAVVTAHGGVHPEDRYFQVVSDEGVLRVTAADLANALRNVGVVVLFVCSGGRADKHPSANTTLGLAKQILDRGCSAVIASPWPLDARVPSHWLPTFLDRWTSGATLIEANFQANKVVDGRFAQDPARGLAMTVFGNPELKLVNGQPGTNATEQSS